MIAALDVSYDEAANRAKAAAIVFDRWDAEAPLAEYWAEIDSTQNKRGS